MKTRIKRLISFVCMMLVFVTAFVSDAMAAEARLSAADRVIRVSCPIQSGFFERDENGNYSGYTYEYLMKIAQRTGWKYEFDVYEPTN